MSREFSKSFMKGLICSEFAGFQTLILLKIELLLMYLSSILSAVQERFFKGRYFIGYFLDLFPQTITFVFIDLFSM